ncbi:Transcription factor [Enterospora canceri]|uniref:Transcription factor n=1 Tax=Enterospora canceri TaxID=1081671 RepID=A0A1Y1S9T5_9MICR|nr:Transcription factor [Enterospora canceri]
MFKPSDQNKAGGDYDQGCGYAQQNEACGTPRRPNLSYAELITMAIESSAEQMLTLKDIYNWISCNYPYYEAKKDGWQNSIRHNLSLNRCFYRVPRKEGSRGKGSYWKINYEYQNVKVNYRTRKYTYVPPQQSIHSLTQILNDNTLLSESIGMSEIPPKKGTIFSGNLRDEDYEAGQPDAYDYDDHSKLDRIFSFK